ncbi:glutamyl aminopeptidase-like [Gigantopelta aegis]|uniref:glutamyl aminopeptidase-like n=1 Tax=Gigantopelta aegis TaxID=1735272 RepID=UPI001B88D36E|nr:glutamyl aminopeptidase-like [Gigantopelta aegis]
MDRNERFPDVTLAEQKSPEKANDVMTKDTVVRIRQADRTGCYVTRFRIIFLGITLVLLIITLLTFIGMYFRREETCGCGANQVTYDKPNPGASQQDNHVTGINQSTPCACDAGSTSAPTGQNPNLHKNPDASKIPPWKQIRLPKALVPGHYDLRLKIDLTNFVFSGSVNISLYVNRSTRFVMFHRSSLLGILEKHVRVVPLGRFPRRHIKRQFYEKRYQFHVLELNGELPVGSEYSLQIGDFRGRIIQNLRGLYKSTYKTRDGTERALAASQLQSTDARRVFPCFDEPDFKATFKTTIIHQPGYNALSNMPVYRSSVLTSGWLKKEFLSTPIMSTYILAFVVADFKSRNYSFNNGYEFRVWAQPEAYSQTEHAMDFGIKAYEFFTEYFNISDVVPKADHVAVPDFSAGAMENWGLVIYRDTALLYDSEVSSSSNKYMVTLIVAHEIAHSWFGNMVTMKWWDDLWLNEGFASILMYFAMDNTYPEWNVFPTQVVEDMFPVMVKDAMVTSHPVSADIKDPDEIHQYFDVISYCKGMAVLRMMQDFIGWDSFRRGLQMYIRKFKFKNAESYQLWQTFTEAVNNTFIIKEIMDTWTKQSGYPVVTVREVNGSYSLEQSRFLLNPEEADPEDSNPFGYKWYIPFTYTCQDSPTEKQLVWLNRGSATIPKPSSGWLLGNVDYMGFFRVNYMPDMWRKLVDQLLLNHTVFPQANRAGLIGDTFALSRAKMLDYEMALNLTRYLKKEMSYVPWRAFLDSIEFLRGMIATRAAYVHLQQYLRNLVAPVFDLVGPMDHGSLSERYLRRIILGIACDVGVEKAVKYAHSMFKAWKKYGTRLPSDQAVLIYSVGVREGGAEEWDFLWEKAHSTSVASERAMMMESLAQTQKPWLLWRYANWLFDPNKIKQQDVRLVMGYFTKTPLARMVALDFLMSRWKDMVNSFGHDPFLMREVIPTVTAFVNSDFHFRQLKNLFEETPLRVASKATENALALARSNIKWMKTHYNQIADWLEKNQT